MAAPAVLRTSRAVPVSPASPLLNYSCRMTSACQKQGAAMSTLYAYGHLLTVESSHQQCRQGRVNFTKSAFR